jgi:hypothetical protein
MSLQALYMVFTMDIGSQNGFFPYLLVGKRYPLLPWIMTLHKEGQQYSILELLYNKKHKCGCLIVESVFGVLKKSFKELLCKTNLDVTLVLDGFTWCCLLLRGTLSVKVRIYVCQTTILGVYSIIVQPIFYHPITI